MGPSSIFFSEYRCHPSVILAVTFAFKLLPAADVLRQQHIDLDTGEYFELAPHRHGCDGFFAAVMERGAA